jgi:glycine/D-amino acid oxidase-like deaminating enzyme
MDLLSARPFWPILDGLPAAFPALERDTRCDVAVIGAGITGAFVAWHLADAGIDTLVLDRREVAHGSTAGSTSLLQYELDEPLHRLARRFGPEFAGRAYRRCRDAIGAIGRLARGLEVDCAFEPRKSLLLASRAADLPRLRAEFAARQAAGLAVEWWPRARLRRESTLPHPAAILSHDAAQVDAYRLAYGLFAAAQRKGARIFDRTEVTRRKFLPRGVELRLANGARVRARRLVIAAGYEADAFLPEPVTALHSTYALVSEPVTEFVGWPAQRALIWETARPYFYLSTTCDDRCIIGGYDEPFRDPAARDRLLPRKTAALQRKFHRWLPKVPLEVATSWAGTFAETEGGLPFIGRHAQVPHTWFALGYGGNGITFSLIAAEIIRAEMLGRADPDAPLFGFERDERS